MLNEKVNSKAERNKVKKGKISDSKLFHNSLQQMTLCCDKSGLYRFCHKLKTKQQKDNTNFKGHPCFQNAALKQDVAFNCFFWPTAMYFFLFQMLT